MFQLYCYQWEGIGIRNTYTKYKRPVSYSKKVMTNVQKWVFHVQGHTFNIHVTIGKVAKYESLNS